MWLLLSIPLVLFAPSPSSGPPLRAAQGSIPGPLSFVFCTSPWTLIHSQGYRLVTPPSKSSLTSPDPWCHLPNLEVSQDFTLKWSKSGLIIGLLKSSLILEFPGYMNGIIFWNLNSNWAPPSSSSLIFFPFYLKIFKGYLVFLSYSKHQHNTKTWIKLFLLGNVVKFFSLKAL